MPTLTTNNFDHEYSRIQTSYQEILKNYSKSLIRKFKKAKGNYHYKFTKKQVMAKNDFQKLEDQKNTIEPIYELRESLKKLYLKHYQLSDDELIKLNSESTRLALGLFKEIDRLDDKYNTFFLPVIHNLMLDMKVKKRGACKHWAEDLLKYLKPIHRDFFDITWGEAHPGNILEHNVAVLIPKGRPFKDGLFIDPWRTAGRPYWDHVTNDKHYPWKRWLGYGRY